MKFSKLIADRYAEEIDLDFSKIQDTLTLKSILSRRSIRKFLNKPISKELLTLLLAASQSAPSKSNLQQYSILVIKDQNIKDELKKLTEKAFKLEVFGAPTFVVNNKLFWGQDRLEYALEELSS